MLPTPSLIITADEGATTLDIPRATAADAGWYQCTAQNVAGSTATRARLYVQVPQPPQSLEQRRLYLPRPTKVIEPEYVDAGLAPLTLKPVDIYIQNFCFLLNPKSPTDPNPNQKLST